MKEGETFDLLRSAQKRYARLRYGTPKENEKSIGAGKSCTGSDQAVRATLPLQYGSTRPFAAYFSVRLLMVALQLGSTALSVARPSQMSKLHLLV